MDIKSQVAPKGLEFKANEFIISDKYATILTVISYPRYINPGFLSSLTSMSGIKVVIKHIPMPFSVIQKMLNKEIADLKTRYQEEKDHTIQERIRQDYESLEQFITMLAASQSKIYDFQMHVMITANSQEELLTKKFQVRNYLEAMELRAFPLRFEQEKVLKSIKTTDVYSISILGGLVCSSELSEDFSYSDSYQVIPEKEDFKAKFGMVDNNITIEKTALDYLTDAAEPFIASDGTPINIQGDFNVNDSSLPIYVRCDLANKDIKISFDDSLNIYYKNEMAYLLCGENLNFAVKKDEVMNLIKHYNSNFSESGIDFSSLLESDFVSSLMENMVMSKKTILQFLYLKMDCLLIFT